MIHSPSQRPRSSSGSAAGDDGGQQRKAPKDKQCPFCQQPFTSSSLGRHLDLYIKPKNPKPADGIHDVRKIKEIRGKITRRQPRNSLKRQGQDNDHDSRHDDHEHFHSIEPDRGYSHERPYDHERNYRHERKHSYSRERGRSESSATPHSQRQQAPEPMRGPLPPASAIRTRDLGYPRERDAEMLSPGSFFTGNQDAMQRHASVKAVFGTANWQGTGVISGLPPHSADMDRFYRPMRDSYEQLSAGTPKITHVKPPSQLGQSYISPRNASYAEVSSHREPTSGGERQPLDIADETEQAAQLALRHVLSSLEAARCTSATANGPVSPATLIFDFDYHGQTFPSLVLRVLPSPRTLFSLQPFATHETWPLDPPDEINLAAIRDHISRRATILSTSNLSSLERQPHAGTNPSYSQAWLTQEVARASAHVDVAWRNWAALDAQERKRAWDREVLRAYAQVTKRLSDRSAELRIARQQSEYFRRQHERLVRAIETSGVLAAASDSGGDAKMAAAVKKILIAASAGEPLNVADEVYEALDRADVEVRDWSYETLVGKWRDKVRLRDSGRNGGRGNDGDWRVPTPPASAAQQLQQHSQPRAEHAAPATWRDKHAETPEHLVEGRHSKTGADANEDVSTRNNDDREAQGSATEPPQHVVDGADEASQGVAEVDTLAATKEPAEGEEREQRREVNGNRKRARPASWADATDEGEKSPTAAAAKQRD